MEKQTDTNLVQDPEPERYYDWMLWKLRQEDSYRRNRMKTMSREEMWQKTVADMQGEIHALQKTVVRLQEQLSKLQDERKLHEFRFHFTPGVNLRGPSGQPTLRCTHNMRYCTVKTPNLTFCMGLQKNDEI